MATSEPGAISASLTRVARRGRMGARTLPQTGEALGQLSASSNGGPADGAATVMRELLGDGAQSPTAGRDPLDAIFGDLGQDPGQSVDAAAARPDAAVVVPSAPPAAATPGLTPAHAPAVPVGRPNRLQRFAPQFAESDPLPSATQQSGAGRDTFTISDGAAAPAVPAARTSRLQQYVSESDRRETIGVRKGMAAANVLAPLVASVSFNPGSDAAAQPRAKALSAMLVAVHRTAVEAAEVLSRSMGEDVPSWLVTQLMATLAREVAERWQRTGHVDVEAFSANFAQVLGSQAPEMAGLISAASENAYVEVNGPDVARFRIAVSVTKAAWVIHDWVTHERLSIDPAGNLPTHFYTYGIETDELVNKLLVRCVNECRTLVAQVDSADLRTAHMQASIGRMANLMGAEYVTQTRRIMNWLGEDAISDAEYGTRFNAARQQLDTRILPHVFEWARVHFIRIEQGAFRAIEDLYEKSTSSSPGSAGAGADRPAGQ
jgi:hypothetical protein